MSALSPIVEWAKHNPKMAGFLSFLVLRKGYQTASHWLTTPKSLKDKVIVITGKADYVLFFSEKRMTILCTYKLQEVPWGLVT